MKEILRPLPRLGRRWSRPRRVLTRHALNVLPTDPALIACSHLCSPPEICGACANSPSHASTYTDIQVYRQRNIQIERYTDRSSGLPMLTLKTTLPLKSSSL